ncbi:GATA zinc finger domain-containing protein 10-like [Teleopsis dalmanni]|uniref:GATA zinc finger domain-containing protein 10-like n=1 Tax=Teleopsis dalmanni TaxID=139649 RepID=UPI0018CF4C99|nr:GATA zinc finger domain-containing protein 10-like [Teleopsis dalmanni]
MTDNNNNINNKNSSNSNESNSNINRQSASPARTIDSHDSTTGSLDTIVDRSLNREEMLQKKIEQSTNTTNAQHQHDSLTNSQISMLQQQSSSEDEVQHKPQPAQQQHFDAQNHIYSSPVYDQKPPLKLTAATLVATVAADAKHVDDLKKPKLITHEEFQKQLQEAVASRANTIDSRISKKQRFPPELIKIKDGDGSTSSLTSSKSKRSRKSLPSSACCSAFPLQIVLGSLQLVLAISLVALGSLLIVREAALSTAGCGIWTGLIAAVTGSLGVVSMRKTQTAFLALSLVCIATSTLALAISGVGLSRDLNRMEEEFELLNSNSEVSAACGLIFTLFLHFVVSIVSVYRCALQICSRTQFF